MVSFTPREGSPTLYHRLGGPQSSSCPSGQAIYSSCPCRQSEPRTLRRPLRSLVTIPTILTRFPLHIFTHAHPSGLLLCPMMISFILWDHLSRPLPEDETATLRNVVFLGRIHKKTKPNFSVTVISHLFVQGWRISSLAPYVYRKNETLNSHNSRHRDYGRLGREAVRFRERVTEFPRHLLYPHRKVPSYTASHSTLISKTASVSEKNSEKKTRA